MPWFMMTNGTDCSPFNVIFGNSLHQFILRGSLSSFSHKPECFTSLSDSSVSALPAMREFPSDTFQCLVAFSVTKFHKSWTDKREREEELFSYNHKKFERKLGDKVLTSILSHAQIEDSSSVKASKVRVTRRSCCTMIFHSQTREWA